MWSRGEWGLPPIILSQGQGICNVIRQESIHNFITQ